MHSLHGRSRRIWNKEKKAARNGAVGMGSDAASLLTFAVCSSRLRSDHAFMRQIFTPFAKVCIYRPHMLGLPLLVVLDGELAVPCSPRSASAGLNPLSKGPELSRPYLIPAPVGRHATDEYEPRQVRKEAAVSTTGCVEV